MSDHEDFLATFLPQMTAAEAALHNGDASEGSPTRRTAGGLAVVRS